MMLDVQAVLSEAALVLVSAADRTPEAEDVKAGWTAFALFIVGIVVVGLLGLSLVRHLRRAQANAAAGMFDDPDGPTPPGTRRAPPAPELPVKASPRLVAVREPASPDGVVLVLHGGASRGDQVMVSPTQLSVIRMIPTARAAARSGGNRLAVYRLLNSYRGWDSSHTPVADCDWAIERIQDKYAGAPVGLIGHSLGGRAALEAGDHRAVASVVALNPWVYPSDDADLSGRRVLVVHGGRDRIAPLDRSETVARRLARRTSVGFVTIPEGKHAMLAHGRDFDRYAAQFTAAVLLDGPGPATGPVARVLAGEPFVTA